MAQAASVLLENDEPDLRRFVRPSFPANGFRLIELSVGKEGFRRIAALFWNMYPVLIQLGVQSVSWGA